MAASRSRAWARCQFPVDAHEFAVRKVPGAPRAGQPGDEEEPAAVFVGRGGAMGQGVAVAGVEDLAVQYGVPDQAQADRPVAVAVPAAVDDGVGDRLADDQFRGLGRMVQPPAGQLPVAV